MTDLGEPAKPADDGLAETKRPRSDEKRQFVHQQTEMGFGFRIEPPRNPLLDKLTDGQITTLIQQDGDEAAGRRKFRWGLLIGGLIAIISLSWLFLAYDQATMLEKVLTHVIAFLGGTGVGWGITKRKS